VALGGSQHAKGLLMSQVPILYLLWRCFEPFVAYRLIDPCLGAVEGKVNGTF
jgi:hypothetical protein